MRCEGWFLDYHKWGKWHQVEINRINPETGESIPVARQQRECQRCGFIQIRRFQ
jgi:hypothetical protein